MNPDGLIFGPPVLSEAKHATMASLKLAPNGMIWILDHPQNDHFDGSLDGGVSRTTPPIPISEEFCASFFYHQIRFFLREFGAKNLSQVPQRDDHSPKNTQWRIFFVNIDGYFAASHGKKARNHDSP